MMKADATKSFEQFNELNQAMLSGMVRLNEIMSDRLTQLLKLHNTVINDSLESGIQYIRALGEMKKPEDAVSSQMSYFNESTKRAMDNAKKYFALAMETNAEVNSAFQQNMESVSLKVAPRKAAA